MSDTSLPEDLVMDILDFYLRLAASQRPMDVEAEVILRKNLWNLYATPEEQAQAGKAGR